MLAGLSICLGLLMGGGIVKRHRLELRVTHEALSLATLVALLVHGLSLLGDGYLHPSLGDIAIPFLGSYETVSTSMGIVAFWMLAILGLAYYARARIGVQRWRTLTASPPRLDPRLVHSLGEGTDAGQAWSWR